MTELLEDLDEQRSKLNKNAEQFRRKRDKLNNTARKWADKRDQLNGQSRENIEKANNHRKKRDKLNEQVKTAKEERETWNKKVAESQAKLGGLKKKHLPNVPNTDEIREKGLNISQFQMKLLEKIEELTLHIIKQHEQIREQQKTITVLFEKVKILKVK